MPANLWQFSYDRKTNADFTRLGDRDYTLPSLISPLNRQNTNSVTGTGGGTIVNVLNGYLWTNSKKRAANQGRDEAPYIILKERRVKANSLVAQALYSGGAVAGDVAAIAKKLGIQSMLDNIKKSDVGKIIGNEFANLLGMSKDAINASIEAVGLGTNTINEKSLNKFTEDQIGFMRNDPTFLRDKYLLAYQNLYITELTGWRFILPFFENYNQSASNTWGSDSKNAGSNFLVKEITGLADSAARVAADVMGGIQSTGSYIETSQFYQFASSGEPVTITFPLINTGTATYQDVINNWQFIFLLLYNNKPERINVNLIDPPPIYEATIPGVKYMPYSYISNLSVQFRGARRAMKIQIPITTGAADTSIDISNQVDFNTIIPEAYEVSITLQGMVADSKNFMYALVDNQSVSVRDISTRIP